MSDHIKVLAEMSGISIDMMRVIVTAQEFEKRICDSLGVASLSELEQLKKSAEQAAALNWLSAKTTPERARGMSRAEAITSASYAPEREQATSPAQDGEPGQVPAAEPEMESKPAEFGWKATVQAEAAALWIRIRKSGGTPKVFNIVDKMATWCRQNEVKTDDGVYPSAGYLRVHVLSSKHWTPPT